LHLDQGDAHEALQGFNAYLEGGGSELREEAMAGKALAFGRQGRSEEEAAAWSALRDAYPKSAYATESLSRSKSPFGPSAGSAGPQSKPPFGPTGAP
jgi:hypothetical protein